MDQSVLDAIARWPNVPAVTGWLSLNCRGSWRLHPLGDAARGGAGEAITNEQILKFIDRNYGHDARGAWFFQNGPQRVYTRLDACPYILRFDPAAAMITTHNGLMVNRITDWIADNAGNLYASTDLGPGRIDDRDLAALADVLVDAQANTLLEILDDWSLINGPGAATPYLRAQIAPRGSVVTPLAQAAPLSLCALTDIPTRMGFIANPSSDDA